MTPQYEKLKSILQEVFQLDQADLDFGIYRIMNQKRDEINDFLENRLLKQVDEILATSGALDSKQVKEELTKLEATLKEAGMNPDDSPKVKELKENLKNAGNPDALTNEVFSHLTAFFKRYYDEGDFISQRRYKKDVYAIPYEGEEVKLHWANHDQYYIKTSEYFRNYAFKLDDGKKVAFFALREASTEQNNNKTEQGKARRFKLAEEDFLTTENDGHDLKIWFTYEPVDKNVKQEDLLKEALDKLVPALEGDFKMGLLKPAPSAKNEKRTILEKHLTNYAARNTFDYFIHKDLGGFLGRELDFYIKNEILHIDDINLDAPQSFDKQLKVIKAFKGVAQKIIAFLAQLEDFQKKLWLKKKMVVKSDYCITLDRVPEELYAEIATNDDQRKEWVSLFAINEIKKDLLNPGYSEPLTVDFLKANPFLVLDTKFFSREFKYQLLANLEKLDEQTDGVLINSENFQAINQLMKTFKERVNCIYIDPPYNTGGDGFTYKDKYQHSSWLSCLFDRLSISYDIASADSNILVSIDDNEQANLKYLISSIYGDSKFESQIIIQSNKRGQTYQSIAKTHEYLTLFRKSDLSIIYELPKQIKESSLQDADGPYELWELRNRNPKFGRHNRPNLYYPIFIDPSSKNEEGYCLISLTKSDQFSIETFPMNSEGLESCWRWGKDKLQNEIEKGPLKKILAKEKRDGGWNIYEKARKSVVKAKSIWSENDVISEQGTIVANSLGLKDFGFPKPVGLISKALSVGSADGDVILDYFAGSGTTGQAVINLNRQDEGSRKFILVEMGEYFDTVTKPRIQKVIYSEDWKNGKPVSRKGSSHCFKYFSLESYEDALNNLELHRSEAQATLLSNDAFSEEYVLNYMLDVEAQDSLLKLDAFKKPFGYTLKITENNELKETEVDLVETFNYLIGLIVDSLWMEQGHVIVQGRNLEGDKILVIWRDMDTMDSQQLNDFFRKLDINTRDSEFKRIYVNGDNHLENLRTDDEQWKVVLIEEEFKKRMFEETED